MNLMESAWVEILSRLYVWSSKPARSALQHPQFFFDKWRFYLRQKIVWYLCRGVILTKDNLLKCNWYKSIVFILFTWRDYWALTLSVQICEIYMVDNLRRFNLVPPLNEVPNIFWKLDRWRGYHRFKLPIRIGALAVIWPIWLHRNDKIFNYKNYFLMQVIYQGAPLCYVPHRLYRVWRIATCL
jgi:hypothetical protein